MASATQTSILADVMLKRFADRAPGYDRDNRFFRVGPVVLTCAFVTPKREITLGRNRKAEVVICEYEDFSVEFTAKGPSIASPPQTFDDTVAKYIAGGCVEMPAEAGRHIQAGDMQA